MTTETMGSLSEKKKEIRCLRALLHDKDAVIATLETDRTSNQGNVNLMLILLAMPFAIYFS